MTKKIEGVRAVLWHDEMEQAKYCGMLAYYKCSEFIYIPVFAGSK